MCLVAKENLKRKAKRLKAQQKALRRASSVIRSTGDQVMSAAEQVDAVVAQAKAEGYLTGVREARRRVNDCGNIRLARSAVETLVTEAEQGWEEDYGSGQA